MASKAGNKAVKPSAATGKKKVILSKETKLVILSAAIVCAIIVVGVIVSSIVTAGYENAVRGNDIGNNGNFGMAVSTDEGLFYSNSGIMRYNGKDTPADEIVADSALYLNYYNGYLYYANTLDSSHLYRIKTDGTGREKLVDMRVEGMEIVDGKVYISTSVLGTISMDERERLKIEGIYSLDADGANLKKISNDAADHLFVYGGRIYFVNKDQKYKLYSMNLDGSARKVVTADFVYSYDYLDGWFYYGTGSELYKVRSDGASKTKLADDGATSLLVHGDYIYYNYYGVLDGQETSPSGAGMKRLSLSGGSPEQLFPATMMGLCDIGEDKLYCTMYTEKSTGVIYDITENTTSLPDAGSFSIDLGKKEGTN